MAQAVDEAAAKGVSYFVAAGNFGSASYSSTFSPVQAPNDASRFAHSFGPNDIYQGISLNKGSYTVVLQWEDQSPATQDLDIFLSTADGKNLMGFNRKNMGGEPVEILPFTISADQTTTNFMITSSSADPIRFKYVVFRGFNGFAQLEYQGESSTIVGQSNARGAMTVGAVRYDWTPVVNGELANLRPAISLIFWQPAWSIQQWTWVE